MTTTLNLIFEFFTKHQLLFKCHFGLYKTIISYRKEPAL